MHLVVTVDGPAASGKSTTAKMVAKRLGYTYLDTGAMYRAMTLKALRLGLDLAKPDALAEMAQNTDIAVETDPERTRVMLDGQDVTDELRDVEVTKKSSIVAAAKGVRLRMVELQRKIGARGAIVAEGRDIGSVVFPQADVKIYLDADLECRAMRRKREIDARGGPADLAKVEADIRARDAYDSGRKHSPLVIPAGATVIDTTGLSIDEQVDRVMEEIRKKT